MFQLIFTSTPKGLIEGRAGFTTVAMSCGFPRNLIPLIENSSAYERLFQADDPNAERNPVNYRYAIQKLGAQEYGVFSRIEFSGPGYSRRGTPIASHLLLTADELLALDGDLARILNCKENFFWNGVVDELPLKKAPRLSEPFASGAPFCAKLLGDSRWALVLARKFRCQRKQPLFFSFDPLQITSEDILAVIAEVLQYLTPQERLDFTFSTYCHQSSQGQSAFLRCYAESSPYLASIRRIYSHSCWKLGNPQVIPVDIPWQEMEPADTSEPIAETAPEFVLKTPAPPSATSKIERRDSYTVELPKNKYAKPSVAWGHDKAPRQTNDSPKSEPNNSRTNLNLMIIAGTVVLMLAIGLIARMLINRCLADGGKKENTNTSQSTQQLIEKQPAKQRVPSQQSENRQQASSQHPKTSASEPQTPSDSTQVSNSRDATQEAASQPGGINSSSPAKSVDGNKKQSEPQTEEENKKQEPPEDGKHSGSGSNAVDPALPPPPDEPKPPQTENNADEKGNIIKKQQMGEKKEWLVYLEDDTLRYYPANVSTVDLIPPNLQVSLPHKKYIAIKKAVNAYNGCVKKYSDTQEKLNKLIEKSKADANNSKLRNKEKELHKDVAKYVAFLNYMEELKLKEVKQSEYDNRLKQAVEENKRALNEKNNERTKQVKERLGYDPQKTHKDGCTCWSCCSKKVTDIQGRVTVYHKSVNSLNEALTPFPEKMQKYFQKKIEAKEPISFNCK